MNHFTKYKELIQKEIQSQGFDKKTPKEIYEPIDYILSLGGKRIRPIFSLLACDLLGGDLQKATKPALALEFFHNFTLVHDDIMDRSPLRRGQKSVHEKFSTNQAILSGDLLFSLSYELFGDLNPEIFKKVVCEFSKMAIQVCQGQQLDLNFEKGQNFLFEDYLQMIYGKTASLIAISFKIGALIAEASKEKIDFIYEMGKNLGLAFQIQDDFLDVFGSSKNTGKSLYGDLYERKKTILYFEALRKAKSIEKEKIIHFYNSSKENSQEEIIAIKNLFESLGLQKEIEKKMKYYGQKTLQNLEALKGNKTQETILKTIIKDLASRTS